MKKRCTPTNNAMHVHTPVECTTPVVPIVEGCKDPFTYVWNIAYNQYLLDSSSSMAEYFDIILDKGLVLTDATDVCCPDCTKSPIYSLSSMETFAKLAQALKWFNELNKICCINTQMGVEVQLQYNKFWEGKQPPCCNNDFESCLNKFSTILSLERLLDKGVIETNTYNGNTLLCKIYDLFINTPEDAFFNSSFSEAFDRIMDKGLVAYCCGCTIVIASVETFLKWIEPTGECEAGLNP
jgi:hypothetical protein